MKKYIQTNSLILILFIAASFNFPACGTYHDFGSGSLSTLQEKTFSTSPGKNFILKASSGDVVVTTSDAPEVYVKILGNERAAKKMKFDFDTSGGGVTVTAEKKDGWNFFNFGDNINLRFEVRLPSNYNAKISSSGGDILISNINGKISLHSSGGDISSNNIQGSLNISTSGGDVKCENTNGPIKLQTSGGDVTCDNFDGDLDASTSGGDISLKGKDSKIYASTSGGEIELNYSGENKGIELSSSGGSIKLNLPADFNASARMYSTGGDINCAFGGNNATSISSSKFEADINQGGEPLVVKTSGGNIDVAKH